MTSTTDSILDEVLSERLRQVQRYGFNDVHDDGWRAGQLVRAALNYVAAAAIGQYVVGDAYSSPPPFVGEGFFFDWPWAQRWWKPGAVRRMLIIAMSLLCAEVERIDRADAREATRR